MGDARLLADDNVAILQQGVELIGVLDDRLYRSEAPGAKHDGVGRQFRHVIDFYQCFVGGLDGRKIDYCARGRDPEVEKEREVAGRALQSLIDRLRGEDLVAKDLRLSVRLERPERPEAPGEAWGDSSVSRELGFLLSHTVHHYALIKWILRAHGVKVPGGFGVAPSTLQHWKESQLTP